MKSAYELAMERLRKQDAEAGVDETPLSAEREIALKDEIAAAAAAGEFEKVETLQQQLTHERKKLQTELEEKKEKIHQPH